MRHQRTRKQRMNHFSSATVYFFFMMNFFGIAMFCGKRRQEVCRSSSRTNDAIIVPLMTHWIFNWSCHRLVGKSHISFLCSVFALAGRGSNKSKKGHVCRNATHAICDFVPNSNRCHFNCRWFECIARLHSLI